MNTHMQKKRLLAGIMVSFLLAGALLLHSLQILSASQLPIMAGWGNTAVAPSHTIAANYGLTSSITSTAYLPITFSPPPTTSLHPIAVVCATNTWTVTWSEGGASVLAYELEEAHLDTFAGPLTRTLTGTQYVASPALSPNNLYYYRARALTYNGAGPWSETQSIIGGYLDTFADPDSGWPQTSGGDFSYAYVGGEYEVASQQAGALYRPASPNYLLGAYAVQTDVHWQGATTNGLYGLLFGVAQDLSQYYLFSIYPDDQKYRLLHRLADGNFAELVSRTMSAGILTGNGVNQLAATWDNGQITLWINGVEVASLTDTAVSDLTGTGVAMSPNPANPVAAARFDNFQVIGCKTPADGRFPATIPLGRQPFSLTLDNWTEE